MSRLAVIGYPHETNRELVAAWCPGGVEDELLGGFTVLTVNGPVEFDGRYSLPRRDAYAAIAEALGLAPTGARRSLRGEAMTENVFTPSGLDALPPPQMARQAEEIGVSKAGMAAANMFALAVLAGAFIALGAIFATTVGAGGANVPYGIARLLAGLAFSLGLILVVVAGAELFTGNNLIVMAWASKRVSTARLLRNWAIVYAGNFVGAIATAGILYLGKQYEFGKGAVGEQAVAIATGKTNLGFVQAIALGAFCNALVCLAVWLCYSARTTTDKVLAIVPPIAAFVAAGFEHSVANMFFIPMGLFVKANSTFMAAHPGPPGVQHLTWGRFLGANLLPVTIGNIIGGALMVGAIYWFVYLRGRQDEQAGAPVAQPSPTRK